jgi:hypothetical protein
VFHTWENFCLKDISNSSHSQDPKPVIKR